MLLPLCALAQKADVAEPKFLPDDPLLRDPPPLNVGKAFNRRNQRLLRFLPKHLFSRRIKRKSSIIRPGPSLAVNTLDEVPDSAWFTNRVGSRPMTIEELVRGPAMPMRRRRISRGRLFRVRTKASLPDW